MGIISLSWLSHWSNKSKILREAFKLTTLINIQWCVHEREAEESDFRHPLKVIFIHHDERKVICDMTVIFTRSISEYISKPITAVW